MNRHPSSAGAACPRRARRIFAASALSARNVSVSAVMAGALLSVSTGVYAQSDDAEPRSTSAAGSVTLYGIIDTNVEFLSHAAAGGGSVVREQSGGLHSSRFGFRGNEPLGGGTAAWFVLESGFNSNDGTQATAGTIFNRTAAVGLQNDRYGSLSFGLQYTPMYDTLAQYDPMDYGQQYTWFPTTGSSDDFAFRARNSNSVKYVGRYRGLTATAEYAFGNSADSFQSSAAYGGALNYDGGPFGLAVAYDYRNGAINTTGTWTKSRNLSISGRYNLGPARITAGYEHYLYNPTKGASAAQALFFGGIRYPVSPAVQLTAAYYYERDKTPGMSNAWMGVLSTQYALSKLTSVYATVAYAQATRGFNNQYTPVGTTDSTAFGPNQTGVTLGILHRF